MKTYKNITSLIIFTIGCFGFATCSNQDEMVVEEENNLVPLEIEFKSIDTRASINGSSLPEYSDFGIYLTDKTNNIDINNALATYANKSCKLSQQIMLNGIPKYVYAYYPYAENISLTGNLPMIPMYSGTTDYLRGYSVNSSMQWTYVYNDAPKANILLKHVMARIILNIRKAEDNQQKLELYDAIFNGINYYGSYNLLGDKFSTTKKGDVKINMKSEITHESTQVELLAIPMESTKGIQLVLDGTAMGYDTYILTMPTGSWIAGQQYAYDVIFEDSKVSISAAQISLWKTNEQSGIEVGVDNKVK